MRGHRLVLLVGAVLLASRVAGAQLTPGQLAELQSKIKECNNDVEAGTDRYIGTLFRDHRTALEVSKWAVANDAIENTDKYRYYMGVISIAALLGDVETAERYLADFQEAYKDSQFEMGGPIGLRPARDYVALNGIMLRAQIEESKRYNRMPGAASYQKAIEYRSEWRRIVADNIPKLAGKSEKFRRQAIVQTKFSFFLQCGRLHQLDGRQADAIQMFTVAVRNWADMADLNLSAPLREGLNRWSQALKDEILLADPSVSKAEKYPVFHRVIDYYHRLTREDIDAAEMHLGKFGELYKDADFPVDGIVGKRNVREYVDLDLLKFKAQIAEGRRYGRLTNDRDYATALGLWDAYRQKVLEKTPDMPESEQKAKARIYTEFTHFEHCGGLYQDDGNSEKTRQMLDQAIRNYETGLAALVVSPSVKDDLRKSVENARRRIGMLDYWKEQGRTGPRPQQTAPSFPIGAPHKTTTATAESGTCATAKCTCGCGATTVTATAATCCATGFTALIIRRDDSCT